MRFRYRYVGFGTGFSAAAAPRIVTRADERDQGFLCENELAVDVGGVCWGHGGVDQPVIDHHFHRADGGQFPSAAAAVLHLAPRIVDRFGGMDGDLCLVTHREPDFDAFCAMYLARCLFEGNIPSAGWDHYGLKPHGWSQGKDEIDWFQPRLNGLPPKYRWPVLLAAYAACVDNGRQLACPRSRSLHSILYAAIVRGRDYLNEDSGALEFFQEVTRNIEDPARGLNPLIDSVLERSETFAPERAMLESEEDAYRRDLRRARPAIVFLQESRVPFPEWFPKLQAVPLLKEDGSPEPVHLRPPDQGRSQADGIYLRDPECLLFKEWARLDREHSSLGQGFLFTAVAYSRGRRGSRLNETDYYFSLDPERAVNRHLYNVWARLQVAEARSLRAAQEQAHYPEPTEAVARKGFDGRAGQYLPEFVDPWFDGHNYACTIVVTPNKGTAIASAGTSGDLEDDTVTQLVRGELEHAIFTSPSALVEDFAASASVHDQEPRRVPIIRADAHLAPPPESYYRFAQVTLDDHVETLKPAMAHQIGRVLWGLLDSDGSEGPPDEVLDQHLVVDAESVCVWSRRGIVVGLKERSAKRAVEIRGDFKRLAALAGAVQYLVKMKRGGSTQEPASPHPEPHAGPDEVDSLRRKRIRVGETLMRRVAQLRHRLALPQARLVRSFFEANHLGPVLETARNVNLADLDRAQTSRMDDNIKTVADVQKTLHWIEIFVISVYAVELFHMLGKSFEFDPAYIAWSIIVVAAVTPVAIASVLQPWRHGGVSRGMVVFLLWIAVLLIGFVWLGKQYFAPSTTKGNETHDGDGQQCHDACPPDGFRFSGALPALAHEQGVGHLQGPKARYNSSGIREPLEHGVGVFLNLVFEAPGHDDGVVENEAFWGLAGAFFRLGHQNRRPSSINSRIVTSSPSLRPLRNSRIWAITERTSLP